MVIHLTQVGTACSVWLLWSRGTERKVLVAVAAEEDGRGTGRIRSRHIPDASAASLTPFIEDSIEPGNLLHADGWRGYMPLAARGYRHKATDIKRREEEASDLLPRVHRENPLGFKCMRAGRHL